MKIQSWQLYQRQGLPLEAKVQMSLERIKAWCAHFNYKVYVSFSGGKDSTVLLDLVRKVADDVPAVFFDTGLEYPEIREFVKSVSNVEWIRPKRSFAYVIEKYGYPVISKEVSQKIYEIRTTKSEILKNKRLHGDENGNGKLARKWLKLLDCDFKISPMCCDALKKNPSKLYEKHSGRKPFIGTMASDSQLRLSNYLRHGCNQFESRRQVSQPLSFWLDEDVWNYIKVNNLPYSSIYDMGYQNTGCMFCIFGCHINKRPNKFELMKDTHPKQYEYCMDKLGIRHVCETLSIPH